MSIEVGILAAAASYEKETGGRFTSIEIDDAAFELLWAEMIHKYGWKPCNYLVLDGIRVKRR